MNACPIVIWNDRQDKAARIQVPRCGEKKLETKGINVELEHDQLIKKTEAFLFYCVSVRVFFFFCGLSSLFKAILQILPIRIIWTEKDGR